MCQICDNNINTREFPNIQGLIIRNCNNVVQIPNIEQLKYICIENCAKIVQIPNIQGLNRLFIIDCVNLVRIPNIQGLYRLIIRDCSYLKNIDTYNKKEIKKYLSILCITQWYKRMKYLRSARYKILWRIADYYTARKYAPENILKYIMLED